MKPYLVQRVLVKPRCEKKGINARFSMDYMGSAEFEYGALPQSLKRMRDHGLPERWEPQKLVCGSHKLWFLGSQKVKHIAASFLSDQMSANPSRLLEYTYMKDIVENKKTLFNFNKPTAWWCVDSGLDFVIFLSRDDATHWMQCLRDAP
jgi:hypothetical protein